MPQLWETPRVYVLGAGNLGEGPQAFPVPPDDWANGDAGTADEVLTPSPRRAPARAAAHKSPPGLGGVGVAVWGRPALLSHLLRPGLRLPPDSGSVLPFSVGPSPAQLPAE